MKIILVILLQMLFIPLLAQTPLYVMFHKVEDSIIVSYDLVCNDEKQCCDISLYASLGNDDKFLGPLRFVTGEVGRKVSAGKGKKIFWNYTKELDTLPNFEKLMFRVEASCKISQASMRTLSDANFTDTVNDALVEMVFVKGGEFMMGCIERGDERCYQPEKPPHKVKLASYYIGKTEVTVKLWNAVMDSNQSTSDCESCPVENVAWEDAVVFMVKLSQITGRNYSLPSEAQWEFAARGGIKSRNFIYSGSNNLNEVGWTGAKANGKVGPVARLKPNEIGIYDMSGNVWEWCQDFYGSYNAEAQINPTGPSTGPNHVIRGGACISGPTYCRTVYRSLSNSYKHGFRLCIKH